MRRCTRCPHEGPDDTFGVKIKSKANDTGVCKTCKSKYNSGWYERNKTQHVRGVQRNNQRYRAEIEALLLPLKSKPCVDCGGTFPPVCMDFDHLDSSTKVASISELRFQGRKTQVLAELAKCELVCANCHRIRTYSRLRSTMDRAGLS